MKWRRSKSSPPSLITRVFPVSWFSKFKQKGRSPENSSGKKQQRCKLDFPTRNSMHSSGFREAVFYSVVDDNRDAYWTLSFREDRAGEGRRRASRINPLWLDSDDEFRVQEGFGLKEMGFTRGVHRSINDMVNDREKMKGKQHTENGSFRKKKHKKEIKAKTESAKISRRSRSRKMKQMGGKAYAGKSDCRIRVLEDMKRGRKKLKKLERGKQTPDLDSFAVVKTSFDPQKDFRDSMAEMIRYKGIIRPKELEQLLACYLTLNSDGYHALIIKAFQQVWTELNEGVY